MPVPPKPFTQECSKCGWKHTVRPVSDVLLIPVRCPRCDNPDMTRRRPSYFELVWNKLIGK